MLISLALLLCSGTDSVSASFGRYPTSVLTTNQKAARFQVPAGNQLKSVVLDQGADGVTLNLNWAGEKREVESGTVVTIWGGRDASVLVLNFGRPIDLYGKSIATGLGAWVDSQTRKLESRFTFEVKGTTTSLKLGDAFANGVSFASYSYLPPEIKATDASGGWELAARTSALFGESSGSTLLPSLTGPRPGK